MYTVNVIYFFSEVIIFLKFFDGTQQSLPDRDKMLKVIKTRAGHHPKNVEKSSHRL